MLFQFVSADESADQSEAVETGPLHGLVLTAVALVQQRSAIVTGVVE